MTVRLSPRSIHETRMAHDRRPMKRHALPSLAGLVLLLTATAIPAQTPRPELVDIVKRAVHGVPDSASASAAVLEALFPGYPEDAEFQTWLALGLARVGYAQEAVAAINGTLEKNPSLPVPIAERLVEAACLMNQHALARASAWRISADEAAERNRLVETVRADLQSKSRGISYADTIARMKAAGAFDEAGSLEPAVAKFEGFPGNLEGVYLQRQGAGGQKFPAVVCFPGGAPFNQPPPPGDVDSDLLQFALRFVREGYCALIVKPRGWNGGEGIYLSDKGAARDLVRGAAFLSGRPEIDAGRIYAVGHGSAGASVLYALMVENAPLAGGVAFAPRAFAFSTDPVEDETPYGHYRSGYLQFRSPGAEIQSVLYPALVVHGTEDRLVTVEQSRRLEGVVRAANAPVSFAFVSGAGHSDVIQGDGFSRALDFLQSTP